MPEYVYVVHHFQPENEDELELQVGERIEVIEKDDEFGDGWWQGRSPAGKAGLFPVSYTTSTQFQDGGYPEPESNAALQTLREEPENESPHVLSPVPKATSVPSFLETPEDRSGQEIRPSSHRKNSSDGEMMRATMTDVQKAIEQLGRGGPVDDYDDGARSFSFASTKESGDTETDDTDFDLSDLDGGSHEGDRGDWHKSARRKLAAKARRAVENAEQLEAMMNGASASTRRMAAPPIDVEISDESEAEDGNYTRTSQFTRTHPGILEEDENEGEVLDKSDIRNKRPTSPGTAASPQQESIDFEVPPKDEFDIPTATAEVRSFQVPSQPPISESPGPEPALAQIGVEKSVESAEVSYPTPASLAPKTISVASSESTVDPQKRPFSSPAALTQPVHSNLNIVVSDGTSKLPAFEPQSQQRVSEAPQTDELKIPTSEWDVDQVVQWLKSKGFDQGICDKFIEQEISGDVLLELDANVLKSEIGIMAYGKRVRIANAIAELRRSSSFELPVQHTGSSLPSPVYSHMNFHSTLTDGGMASMMHSRMKSQSQQSHHSFPGSGASIPTMHKYSQSMQSSVSSAPGLSPQRQQEQVHDAATAPSQDVLESAQRDDVTDTTAPVGLGINLTANGHHPPTLSPSPSDTALGTISATTTIPGPSLDDERGHLSEGEAAPTTTSMRRRLFGRSQDSTASGVKSTGSKESFPSTVHEVDKDSAQGKEKESPRYSGSFGARKGKRVSESGKQADRLSIFGGSFVGPLSKHRKPPPSDISTERPSKFTLPRLQSRKSSASHRPSTPVGSPYEKVTISAGNSPVKEKHSNNIDASKRSDLILRKRTSSAPHPTSSVSLNPGSKESVVTGTIKQGQSILQQIGEPDYAGWMRKKGERYNMWKTRYFVLQGPHLYCLRSSSNTEKRLKDYINIQGYRVTVDEGIDPGRYGFRIEHDHDKTHYFSSEEKSVVREWMKAFMKATIERDYTKPIISSCNIPTIPLVVAQAMNPAPRPPSPTARAATQRALLRENTSQLSTRDARVLMGLPGDKEERPSADAFFSNDGSPAAAMNGSAITTTPPSRPSRRSNSVHTARSGIADDALIEWANSHLPEPHQIRDPNGSLCSGLALLRLAETIKGQSASPPVPDSAFPQDVNDENLDGYVRLFDFLLNNEVKMGSVNINDVRFGKKDKVLQVLKGLKSWEEKRKMLSTGMMRLPQTYVSSGFWMPMAP